MPTTSTAATRCGFLDLLAEVTVAARMGGERERAWSVATRGLKLMERADAPDPLRAAWFWAQRCRDERAGLGKPRRVCEPRSTPDAGPIPSQRRQAAVPNSPRSKKAQARRTGGKSRAGAR